MNEREEYPNIIYADYIQLNISFLHLEMLMPQLLHISPVSFKNVLRTLYEQMPAYFTDILYCCAPSMSLRSRGLQLGAPDCCSLLSSHHVSVII